MTEMLENRPNLLSFVWDAERLRFVSSGGSRISPRWGRQLPRGGANIQFCHIFPKTG